MIKTFSKIFPWGLFIVALTATAVAVNCGRSGGGRSGDSISDLIPAGWDGTSDWEGSRWAVSNLSLVRTKTPAANLSGNIAANKSANKSEIKVDQHCAGLVSSEAPYLVRVKSDRGASLRGKDSAATILLIESEEELQALAAKTHGSHLGGCAGIEVISGPGLSDCGLDLTQTTVTTVTAPIFDETIKLAATEALLPQAAAANITATMTTLQGLGSRYYSGASGPAASNQVQTIYQAAYAGSSWPSGAIATAQVSHSGIAANQPSVVSALSGTTDDATMVVIGSHLDSINQADQSNAPGADDNASGVGILAETLRVLAANNIRFKRRVEWHAYGAEEIGLIGSGQIATNYAAAGKKVAAMLQIDMASYASDPGGHSGETIHLFHDDTNAILRRSTKDLLTTYLGGNFSDLGQSVSGTSDHRSWYRAGFPTVFPFENPVSYNHKLHTADDTVANATSPNLAVRMSRLILAFLAHHAGIAGADADYAAKLAAASRDSDIKMALLDYDQVSEESRPSDLVQGGTLAIFSAPETIAAVESCSVTAGAATACTSDRLIGTKIEGGPTGRSFFYVVFPPDGHNAPERAFGYSAENTPSHGRSLSVSKK